MPLDRRITLEVQAEGSYVDGEYVAGAATTHELWASRMDASLEDIDEAGGSRDETLRSWRVRWIEPLASAENVSRITVIEDGARFAVVNVSEETNQGRTRRRWMLVEGVRSS